jgi:ABC-type transport system substrate-binding protein
MASYWDKLLHQRIARRRALISAGGLAAGAAFLAACGGDDGDETQALSGNFYKPTDTTEEGKRGGTWRTNMTADPTNFDLHRFDAFLQPFSNVIGSQLLKVAPLINKDGTPGHELEISLGVEGDVAESWEMAPDRLSMTIKLNQQAKWAPTTGSFHAGAPTSIAGRTIDADDVVFSWERLKTGSLAAGRLDLAYGDPPLSKSAPITSVTKIDDRTVQLKMIRPTSSLLASLATWNVGYWYILPKEGRDNAVDFEKYSFGAGPFYIDSFEPSVRMVLKRNPFFEQRDTKYKRPFADEVSLPVVPDQSTREAQFRAGNLFNVGFATLDDTLKTKQDIPELSALTGYANQGEVLEFGSHRDSPWKDMRLRQAVSMAWNRDQHIEAILSIAKLEAAGIPSNVRWAAGLSGNEQGFPNGTYKGYWLDPQSGDFGENAKYFQYNPDEAKKLIAAAGFSSGIRSDFEHGFAFPSTTLAMDLLAGSLAEMGINLTRKMLTTSEGLQKYNTPYPLTPNEPPRSWGNWVGIRTAIDSGGPDPASYMHQMYHREGGRFLGYNPSSNGASVDGDPRINEIIEKMIGEFDEKKRIDLAHEFQRYHAESAYRFRYPGCATTVALWWPAVTNLGVWVGESFKRIWTNEWIDTTKAPFV